jgi:hypothetical protein
MSERALHLDTLRRTSFWSSSQQKPAIGGITPFDDAHNVEFLSLFLASHLHRV